MIYMNYYNTDMKKLIFATITLLIAGAATADLFGQGQGTGQGALQDDGEKLTAYKIAFFTRNLNLTPAEAEKFWPLYNDYSARKNKLQADRIVLMRYAAQNEANMTDSELTATADKLVKSFVDEAEMVVDFNEGLKKVLPPAKVIRLYQIENLYKQQLLRELNQRRQGAGQQGLRGRGGQAAGPGLQE
jgi:hypothetical protein